MGLIVGALLTTGILTVIRALCGSAVVGGSDRPRYAGDSRWSGLPGRLGSARVAISWRRLGISICCGLGLALAAVLGTGHPFLVAAGGVIGLWLPVWHARHAGRKARDIQRLAWPDRIAISCCPPSGPGALSPKLFSISPPGQMPLLRCAPSPPTWKQPEALTPP